MTIKIPRENIFDKILKLVKKERKVIISDNAYKVYQNKGPYVQIRGKRENFWKVLFRIKDHSE